MTDISTDEDGAGPSMPRLLSIGDVADILGVSQRTVQRLISCQKLPSYRIRGRRRIAPNDVKKFLREHRECGRDEDDVENDEDDENDKDDKERLGRRARLSSGDNAFNKCRE
jgi:excisionase family DNA binding protein